MVLLFFLKNYMDLVNSVFCIFIITFYEEGVSQVYALVCEWLAELDPNEQKKLL